MVPKNTNKHLIISKQTQHFPFEQYSLEDIIMIFPRVCWTWIRDPMVSGDPMLIWLTEKHPKVTGQIHVGPFTSKNTAVRMINSIHLKTSEHLSSMCLNQHDSYGSRQLKNMSFQKNEVGIQGWIIHMTLSCSMYSFFGILRVFCTIYYEYTSTTPYKNPQDFSS